MLENTLLVARQAAILFIIMGVGAAAAKAGWLKEDGAKQMTNVVFFIATPCIIIQSFLTAEFTPEIMSGMLKSGVFAVAAHLFGILISRPFFRREPETRRSVYRMSVPFSNCGFMGIPLASGIFGAESVIYVSVYIAVFNLFSWTYGISLFRREKRFAPHKLIVNPGALALIAGCVVALTRWKPPELIGEPVRLLSLLNSPVAMIVLGYYLCASALRPQPGEGKMWLVIALKLLAIPAAAMCASAAMGLNGLWLAAAMVLTAAPCATNILLFAAMYDGDTALAARTVSYSTLISLATMPVFLGIAMAANPL